MKKIALVFLGFSLLPVHLAGETPNEKFQKNWPQWRGHSPMASSCTATRPLSGARAKT
ncbi:MAG: hypothetical protein ACE5I1_15245 [bacterium]